MYNIPVSESDYKKIFVDIAFKLHEKNLISGDEKLKLISIIHRDETLNIPLEKSTKVV